MTPATADGHVRARISRRAGEIRRLAEAGRRTRLLAMGAAAFCLLAGVYLAVHREDASHLREATDLSDGGSQGKALAESDQVSRRPAETRALLLRASALAASGRRPQALDAFALAADRAPNNWIIHRDWAVELRASGRRRAAARRMGVALGLNPRLDLPPGFTR